MVKMWFRFFFVEFFVLLALVFWFVYVCLFVFRSCLFKRMIQLFSRPRIGEKNLQPKLYFKQLYL